MLSQEPPDAPASPLAGWLPSMGFYELAAATAALVLLVSTLAILYVVYRQPLAQSASAASDGSGTPWASRPVAPCPNRWTPQAGAGSCALALPRGLTPADARQLNLGRYVDPGSGEVLYAKLRSAADDDPGAPTLTVVEPSASADGFVSFRADDPHFTAGGAQAAGQKRWAGQYGIEWEGIA